MAWWTSSMMPSVSDASSLNFVNRRCRSHLLISSSHGLTTSASPCRTTSHHGLRRHGAYACPRAHAYHPSTCRDHPLCPQHHLTAADLQAARGLPARDPHPHLL